MSLRTRTAGETIGNGDFIVAGEQKFLALETCLVGQVIRDSRFQVLTYDPAPIDMVALAKNLCFPPKPTRPACERCGEPAEYAFDDDDRAEHGRNITVHLCRDCATSLRERLLNA